MFSAQYSSQIKNDIPLGMNKSTRSVDLHRASRNQIIFTLSIQVDFKFSSSDLKINRNILNGIFLNEIFQENHGE